MTTIDVAVRAASTFRRTRPLLQDLAWGRRTLNAKHMPEYLEAAIWDECAGKCSGVAVVIRVVAP